MRKETAHSIAKNARDRQMQLITDVSRQACRIKEIEDSFRMTRWLAILALGYAVGDFLTNMIAILWKHL
jgi:hypothetical protein